MCIRKWGAAHYDLMGNMTFGGLGYCGCNIGSNFTYNTAGRLISFAENTTTYLSGVHYDAAGRITSDTLGDGEAEPWTYNKRGWPVSSTATLNSTNIYSYNINSFAPNGDILAASDSANGNWNYSYDQFNRLVCANLASNGTCATPPTGTPTYTYVYDRFGNRWQQNGPHSMQLSFSGANNRMDGYTYDAAGNLLNDGSHEYFYDAENHLIQVDGSSGYCSSGTGTSATACYFYDANGHRVRDTAIPDCNYKSGLSGGMGYTYDLSGRWVMSVATGGGGPCSYDYYAGGRHVLYLGGGETQFSHADWLGTERVRTSAPYGNTAWSICESIASLPFGDGQVTTPYPANGWPSGCSPDSHLHFTGKERDTETGLDNFGARYNSSSFGRFMTPDWSAAPSGVPYADFGDPQSLNLYAYVQNNPLKSVDPSGHCIVDGETHGWLWCAAHALGFTETKKEAAARQEAMAAYARYRKRMMEKYGYDPDFMMFLALTGGMLATTASTEGGGDAESTVGPEQSAASIGAEAGWVRVGRWMSQTELAEMEATGTAVESSELGSSRVALPASPDTWKAPPAGDVYVEYDVPAGSVKPNSPGQGRIPGPNSPEARLAAQQGKPAPAMPPVRNIKVVKTK